MTDPDLLRAAMDALQHAVQNLESAAFEYGEEDGREAWDADIMLFATIAAQIRARLESGGDDGWRPIATAPRDETVVLLFDARDGVGIGIGQFCPERREIWERVSTDTQKLARIEDRGIWNGNNGSSLSLGQSTLTHWRPLPAPPETKEDLG